MARFYALSIQPTLFGHASLLRCWGRIGCRGQQKVHMFEHEDQAVELFLELLSAKRKKGYRPRTSCGKPEGFGTFSCRNTMTSPRLAVTHSDIDDNAEN
ncbi:WGR domain-containing protein [Rhizobium leguminosarum]|uniref:WGR domain-containing protein n=1 Tax=Rhizobium leguminosarum TaxID=384 RepID=UPI0032B1F7A6